VRCFSAISAGDQRVPRIEVSATASSGLPVSFSAEGDCGVSGATVHITGAGSCTITASQAGDGDFEPAPSVERTFSIAKTDQTISFAPLPNKTVGDADFTLTATATASSGLPVSFSAEGDCGVSGATVHITGAGSCTITASQAGDADRNAAPAVSRTFSIAAPKPVTPPQVKITSGPPRETTDQSAAFIFSGVPGGTYECSLDSGPWRGCRSGEGFGPSAPGDHRFRVRETLNGLTGPADSYFWTIALPRECVLRVARGRVLVNARQRRIRLVISYKTYRPADVTVAYRLVGGRGWLALGRASSHFSTAGLFRLRERLSAAEMRKVRLAKLFTVRFTIPETPGSCGRYYTKRLTIPKRFSGQTVWFQSDSLFGPMGLI
jgi:hypothetical protein